jgi:hypothetical protein
VRYRPGVRPVLILCAAVALLAGCGGGGGSKSGDGGGGKPTGPPLTKQAYQAKLQSISKEIGNSIGSSTGKGKIAKKEVDKLVGAFHTFADRLREVNPPVAVKALHAQLVKAMDDLGDEFPDVAKKLNSSSKDPSAAITALFGAHAVQELIKVGNGFKKKGYDLNLNGS